MKVRFKIRGAMESIAFLKDIPRDALRPALAAFVEYVIGNSFHGLKHADPYKYASRAAAYGDVSEDGAPAGYFSWKQFRYVAAITKGFTQRGSHRTGKSQDVWTYKQTTYKNAYIQNPTQGAYFTQDDKGQARQPANVGWRKALQNINDNMAGGIRAAQLAVNRWIKENRK